MFSRNFKAVSTLSALGLALSLVFSLDASARHNKPERGIAGLSWMAGSWAGEHDGGVIEEHWMLPSGKSMVGMSRLVVGEKTAFWECLRIVERDDGSVVYLAQPAGRCPPVEFLMTSAEVGSVTFENPRHDDPQVIRYTLSEEGKTLTAVTEGESKGQRTVHETVMKSASLR
ncbi:MAG: hypothetical protein JNK58_09955 [Phycisphaerae bacterium]|nr:hypothetical protein [Phycisphaerae bacterium]